jgi:hypothetical protein
MCQQPLRERERVKQYGQGVTAMVFCYALTVTSSLIIPLVRPLLFFRPAPDTVLHDSHHFTLTATMPVQGTPNQNDFR